jgi:hypothetical protein
MLSIDITQIPYNLTDYGVVKDSDDTTPSSDKYVLRKINKKYWFNISFAILITNHFSLQATEYRFIVYSSNELYVQFSFSFTVRTCSPSLL